MASAIPVFRRIGKCTTVNQVSKVLDDVTCGSPAVHGVLRYTMLNKRTRGAKGKFTRGSTMQILGNWRIISKNRRVDTQTTDTHTHTSDPPDRMSTRNLLLHFALIYSIRELFAKVEVSEEQEKDDGEKRLFKPSRRIQL